MSKVYLMQEPLPKSDGWTPDLSMAAEHGAIKAIFDRGDRVYIDTDSAVEKARLRLKDFDPNEDFLLWVGFADPSVQWLVPMVLVDMGYKEINYLFWSKRPNSPNGGYYYPIKIKL